MAEWNRFVRAISESPGPYLGLATGDKLCTWYIGQMTLEPDDVWNRIQRRTEQREAAMAAYRQQIAGIQATANRHPHPRPTTLRPTPKRAAANPPLTASTGLFIKPPPASFERTEPT